MRTKDIKPGQSYFYQWGRASWRQKVNGDGAAYILSTETFVATTTHDRGNTGMAPYVRESEYTGLPSISGRTKGMLAVVIRTIVHEGDIPQAARELVATMTLAQVSMIDFRIPQHISAELRKLSCFADIALLQPQTLLGEWDEVYGERKRQAQIKLANESSRSQAQRDNADRWQGVAAEIAELLGEDVHLHALSSRLTGDLEGKTRGIDIDVLEKLVRLAQENATG